MTAPLATGEVLALCGREHKACRKKRGGPSPQYKMFAAAAEGCLMCVRYYVELDGIPHDAASENNKYTALDFATWAASQDQTDTQAVQLYLRQKQAHGAEGVIAAQGLVQDDFPRRVMLPPQWRKAVRKNHRKITVILQQKNHKLRMWRARTTAPWRKAVQTEMIMELHPGRQGLRSKAPSVGPKPMVVAPVPKAPRPPSGPPPLHLLLGLPKPPCPPEHS